MADIAIFRINYKSDFILTLQSDAGWMTPFCIKFWTGAPSQAYFAGYDGTTYTHCAPVAGEPTKLLVQFDDHHLPIGDLKFQIGYHFTVDDFPTSMEDEVLNQASVIIEVDGEPAQVMLDLNGETAPEIEFSLPAYANEAQRIANEEARIAAEQQRIANEEARIAAETIRQQNEQQRIDQETARVNEFATLKSQSQAATRDANAAATLANEKAQLAADKAALAQQKAEYAQQQGGYAKDQGDYAKNQGNYAKEQGEIAQADHERAEADHGIAVDDHTQAGNDHTRAESDHGIAVNDHTQAGNDHTRAESDHGIAVDDHTQAGNDHTRAEADHGIAADDHTQAGNDHTRAASDHTRAESDHAAVEVYVDSLGAFDISAYNATGGVLAKYADLTAALGTNGANIPDALRKGGMSVKFVLSSDHKYVQYRLTADEFSTTESDWQGVDEEPKAGSHNLVESRGVNKCFGISENIEIAVTMGVDLGKSLQIPTNKDVTYNIKLYSTDLIDRNGINVYFRKNNTTILQGYVTNGDSNNFTPTSDCDTILLNRSATGIIGTGNITLGIVSNTGVIPTIKKLENDTSNIKPRVSTLETKVETLETLPPIVADNVSRLNNLGNYINQEIAVTQGVALSENIPLKCNAGSKIFISSAKENSSFINNNGIVTFKILNGETVVDSVTIEAGNSLLYTAPGNITRINVNRYGTGIINTGTIKYLITYGTLSEIKNIYDILSKTIRSDISQSFTDTEKGVARDNIGIINYDDNYVKIGNIYPTILGTNNQQLDAQGKLVTVTYTNRRMTDIMPAQECWIDVSNNTDRGCVFFYDDNINLETGAGFISSIGVTTPFNYDLHIVPPAGATKMVICYTYSSGGYFGLSMRSKALKYNNDMYAPLVGTIDNLSALGVFKNIIVPVTSGIALDYHANIFIPKGSYKIFFDSNAVDNNGLSLHFYNLGDTQIRSFILTNRTETNFSLTDDCHSMWIERYAGGIIGTGDVTIKLQTADSIIQHLIDELGRNSNIGYVSTTGNDYR